MNTEKIVVSIIPARGGSKGVPRKNIKLLGGKPLIYYSIYPSLQSRLVKYTFVSTEDDEIASVAKELGAEVIPRPAELAGDATPDMPVLKHAVEFLQGRGVNVDLIVFLRPTQPLRTTADIDKAVTKALETGAESVHTIHEAKEHPFWMNKMEGDDLKSFVEGGWDYTRRQDLPKVYKSNGLVDVMTRDLVMIKGKKRGDTQKGIITEQERGVDIDTEFDFVVAEMMVRKLSEEEVMKSKEL